MAEGRRELVREMVGGEPYEYFPLGDYIVSAPGICDGEPTFKYTRIGVRNAMELISSGRTAAQVAEGYRVPLAAVQEALDLATQALIDAAA
jgi:uncharacterized protein (DUF433 family)